MGAHKAQRGLGHVPEHGQLAAGDGHQAVLIPQHLVAGFLRGIGLARIQHRANARQSGAHIARFSSPGTQRDGRPPSSGSPPRAALMRGSVSMGAVWSTSVVPTSVTPSQGKANSGRRSTGCRKLITLSTGSFARGKIRWLPRSRRRRGGSAHMRPQIVRPGAGGVDHHRGPHLSTAPGGQVATSARRTPVHRACAAALRPVA